MNRIQYTIRNVPAEVDNALRLRAKKKKKSFNSTVLEVLSQSTVAAKNKPGSDLAWFYGSGGLEKAELDAFASQRVIDKKARD